MRINYITLSCANNYGAVLQTYALMRFLKEHGYDVHLIDYITERYQIDRPDYVYRSTRRWSKNAFTRFLWKYIKHKSEVLCRDCFRKFITEYVPRTEVYFSNEQLKDNLPAADAFISGSDQIWNTNFSWDGKPDLPYFLDFVPDDIPKIAYSSSFGKAELKQEEKAQVKALLARFAYIGTREQTGKQIVNELGLDATTVLDPTLLCEATVWQEIATERKEANDYMLLFQIFPNKEFTKTAQRIAKEKKLKLIILSANPMHRKYYGKHAIYLCKVEDWLSYFRYAEYILTDSFHATVFSILFNRSFATSINAINPSRITGLLERLDLTERQMTELAHEGVMAALSGTMDMSEINAKIRALRAESEQWLLNAIRQSTAGKKDEHL